MTESISILLALVLGGILLVWVRHLSYGWRGPSKSGARLPKGSFGLPVIGESIAYATDPAIFYASRIKRYGTVFKSNLFAQPTFMGTTPEFARFILGNSNLFPSGWPANVTKVLGPGAFPFRDGPPHMTVKKLIQKPMRHDALRSHVNVLETIILQNLDSWAQEGTVVGEEGTQMITIETGFWMLMRTKDIRSTEEGRKALEDFRALSKALNSVPVNLPGTNYSRGLKAKVGLSAYMKPILQKRKGQKNLENDVMGALLSAQDDEEMREELKDLNDDRIIDNLIAIMFAAFDTTAMNLAWVLKYLIEYPDAFRRIQAEHEGILKDKDPSVEGPRLTLEDMRNMEYTSQFFHEVQRIVSVVPILTRKATRDVEYQGHLIPKGWGVSVALTAVHADHAVYPDPKTFNPDRFRVAQKPYTYLSFGAGTHMCPGGDLAKLLTQIFIHHLVTTFSIEAAGSHKGVEYKSLPVPIGEYLTNIKRATKSS